MAEAEKKTKPGIGATLWSLLMMVCLLLVVAHLVQAVRWDTSSDEDLIRSTFTTIEPKQAP
jgi:hypothetical protein